MRKVSSRIQDYQALWRSDAFRRLCILGLLLGCCSAFYYFGEIVDFAGWESLRWSFFYTVHDIHRLLFLIPIVYAGWALGARAAILTTVISVGVCLPRALFISPYPDPILRPVLFILIAGTLGHLAAKARSTLKQRSYLEATLRREIDRLSAISEGMAEGILIIGPDHRIRYFNRSMRRDFGEITGSPCCYQYLRGLDGPCADICKLPEVMHGAVTHCEYELPNGRIYDVLASPYVDSDGVVCQLSSFRDVTERRKNGKQLPGQPG